MIIYGYPNATLPVCWVGLSVGYLVGKARFPNGGPTFFWDNHTHHPPIHSLNIHFCHFLGGSNTANNVFFGISVKKKVHCFCTCNRMSGMCISYFGLPPPVHASSVRQDMHLERMICTTAVSDLSAAIERWSLRVWNAKNCAVARWWSFDTWNLNRPLKPKQPYICLTTKT